MEFASKSLTETRFRGLPRLFVHDEEGIEQRSVWARAAWPSRAQPLFRLARGGCNLQPRFSDGERLPDERALTPVVNVEAPQELRVVSTVLSERAGERAFRPRAELLEHAVATPVGDHGSRFEATDAYTLERVVGDETGRVEKRAR